jgi:hypothetical protein
MSQPRISQLNIWDKYKKRIFDLILESLSILQREPALKLDEPNLNRKLFFCFEGATYNLKLSYHLPTPEGKNPPHPDDEKRARREEKVPDFYWQFSDHTVIDPKRCTRRFVLECKRLGKPTSSQWILNQQYVQNGIRRFVTEEHGYGKGDDAGAMIGYVQNMEFDDILYEVNVAIKTAQDSIPELSPPGPGWLVNGVSQLDQVLERTFLQSPYHLRHFWVDLRNCYSEKSG